MRLVAALWLTASWASAQTCSRMSTSTSSCANPSLYVPAGSGGSYAGSCTTAGALISSGNTCAQKCDTGLVRKYGQEEVLTCSNGVSSAKPLECDAKCSILKAPARVDSCQRGLVNDDFGVTNSKTSGTLTTATTLTLPTTTVPAGAQTGAAVATVPGIRHSTDAKAVGLVFGSPGKDFITTSFVSSARKVLSTTVIKALDAKSSGALTAAASTKFGAALDAAEFGDGSARVVAVGAPGAENNKGAVHLLWLKTSGAVSKATDLPLYSGGVTITLGANEAFGSSVAFVPALSGLSGSFDLIVGAPGYTSNRGAIYVFTLSKRTQMPSGKIFRIDPSTDAKVKGSVTSPSSKFGSSLGSLQAKLSKGYEGVTRRVVAVGAPYGKPGGNLDAGRVWLLRLKSDGSAVEQVTASIDMTASKVSAAGISAGWLFGSSLVATKDTNGDFIPDLVVRADKGSSTHTLLIQVSLVVDSGEASQTSATLKVKAAKEILEAKRSSKISWLDAGDEAGSGLSMLSDVTGDGLEEVILGVPLYDSAAGTNAGAISLLDLDKLADPTITSSSSGSFNLDADVRLIGTGQHIGSGQSGLPVEAFDKSMQHNEYFGYTSHVTCDLDGDGVRDLLVSAPYFDYLSDDQYKINDNGAVYVMLMNQDYTVKAWNRIRHVNDRSSGEDGVFLGCGWTCNGQNLGYRSIRTIGDLDNDGNCEVAVSTFTRNTYYKGGVLVFFMNKLKVGSNNKAVSAASSGKLVKSVVSIHHSSSAFSYNTGNYYEYMGQSIATPGDINNDGIDDIIIGSPGHDRYYSNNGMMYVMALQTDARVKTWRFVGAYSGNFDTLWCCDAQMGFDMHEMKDMYHTSDGQAYPSIVVSTPYADNYYSNMGGAWTMKFRTDLNVHQYHRLDRFACGYSYYSSNANFGFSLAPVGDIDGDGGQDVFVWAHGVQQLLLILLNKYGYCKSSGTNTVKRFYRTSDLKYSFAGWTSQTRSYLDGISPAPSLTQGTVTKPLYGNFESSTNLLIPDTQWRDPKRNNWYTGRTQLVRVATGQLSGIVKRTPPPKVSFTSTDNHYTGYSTYGGWSAYSHYPTSVKSMGDWNKDGNTDIVVGMPHTSRYYYSSGSMMIINLDSNGAWPSYGSSGSSSQTSIFTNGMGGFGWGDWQYDSFGGWDFAADLDINGDGVGDVVYSAPYWDQYFGNAGAISITILTKSGNVAWRSAHYIHTPHTMRNYGKTPWVWRSGGYLGFGLENAGDLNGDGVTDLIATGGSDQNNNRVYVFYLKRSANYLSNWVEVSGAVASSNSLKNMGGYHARITKFSDTSDFFGDGNPDFAIGAPEYDATYSNQGGVWIVSLKDKGQTVANSKLISRGINGGPTSIGSNDYWGSGVAAIPDQDGDGFDELLVGAPYDEYFYSNDGAFYKVHLNSDGTAKNGAQYIRTGSSATDPGRLFTYTSNSNCGAGIASFKLNDAMGYQTIVACRHYYGYLNWYRPKGGVSGAAQVQWAPRWMPLGDFDYSAAYDAWPVTATASGDHRLTSNPDGAAGCFPNVMTLNNPAWRTDESEMTTVTASIMPRKATGIDARGGITWRIRSATSYYYLSMGLSTPKTQVMYMQSGTGNPTKVATFECDLAATAKEDGTDLARVRVTTYSAGKHEIFCGMKAIRSGEPTTTVTNTKLTIGNDVGVWASSGGGNVDFDDVTIHEQCPSVTSCGLLLAGQTCEFKCSNGFQPSEGTETSRECSPAGAWIGTALKCVSLPPTFPFESAPFNRSVNENSLPDATIGKPIVASTGSSQVATLWRIIGGNGPDNNWFQVGRCDGQLRVLNAELDYESRDEYEVMLGVSPDGDLEVETIINVTVMILDVNDRPEWKAAAPEISVREDIAVNSLMGTALSSLVSDPEGTPPKFAITIGDPDSIFSVDSATTKLKVAKKLSYETKNFYELGIRAIDGKDATLFKDSIVKIGLIDVNEAPYFSNAVGSIREIPQGTDLTNMNASDLQLSTYPTIIDEDFGQQLNYTIVPATGTNGDDFTVFKQGEQLFIQVKSAKASLLDHEKNPSLKLRLKVTDTGSPPLSVTEDVTVNVIDVNEPPAVQWPTAAIKVPENSAVSTKVTTISASDPDKGQVLTWSIGYSALPGTFRVVNGDIEVRDPKLLDFEGTGAGPFMLELAVADSGIPSFVSRQNISIVITDVNEPPMIQSGQSFSIAESALDSADVGTVVVIDPDSGDAGKHTLVIVSDEADGKAFKTASGTTKIVVNSGDAIDYETRPKHTVSVQVIDPSGLRGSGEVTVNIQDVNEEPRFRQSAFSASVAENAALGSNILDLGVSDPDVADIAKIVVTITSGDASGLFEVVNGYLRKRTASKLTPGKVTLGISARDSVGNTATTTVALTIVDSNEAPVASDRTRSVSENSKKGALVGAKISATDPDGDALRFAIDSGDINSAFAIDELTGQIKVAADDKLDFETTPTYILRVRISDTAAAPLSTTIAVTVSVTNLNEAPAISASQSSHVKENSPSDTTVGTVKAVDPDANDIMTFSIFGGNDANLFKIDPNTGAITTARPFALNYEAAALHTLKIRAQDKLGERGEGDYVVFVDDVNDPPVLDDTVVSVREDSLKGSSVSSAVRASDEDIGDRLTYSLDPAGVGRACWASNPSLRNSFYWSPFQVDEFEVNSTKVITMLLDVTGDVQVSLREQGTSKSPATPTGSFYTIQLHTDQSPAGSSSKVLKCSGSSGLCSTVGTSQAGFTPVAGRATASGLRKAWIALSPVGDASTSTATDIIVGEGDFASSMLSDLTSKSILAARDSSPLNPTRIGVLATVDGSRFTGVCYKSSAAAGSDVFTLDSVSAALAYRKGDDVPSLDFESQSVYGMLVKVQDDNPTAGVGYGVVLVEIADVNEAPVWSTNDGTCGLGGASKYGACVYVKEDALQDSTVGVLAPVDPDTAQAQTVTITLPMLDAGSVEAGKHVYLDSSDGKTLRVKKGSGLDHETAPFLELQVTATDNGSPTQSSTTIVAIVVEDVNEPPSWPSGIVREVDENSALGTNVGSSVNAIDPDDGDSLTYAIVSGGEEQAFAISSAGQITVTSAANLDYETRKSYSVRVEATDSKGLTSTGTITVQIRDVNEKPTIMDATRAVDENSAARTKAGAPLPASDPDEGQTLTFSIIGGDAGLFTIDRCSGQLSVSPGASLDFETKNSYTLTVQVTDDGVPTLSDSATITVNINDVNEAPTIDAQTVKVSETAAVDDKVGTGPLEAKDEDAGDTFTFAIASGNTQGFFKIDASTGQLLIAKAGLDYETPSLARFELDVKVTDKAGLSATGRITVDVIDANEPPVFEKKEIKITENTAKTPLSAGSRVGTKLAVSDPDAGHTSQLVFSIVAGNGNGLFAIERSGAFAGQLSVTAAGAAAMDYETTKSFSIDVAAADPGGLSTTETISIVLTDVNEKPVAADKSISIDEGKKPGAIVLAAASIGASDPETDAADLQFKITGGNSKGLWSIDQLGGNLRYAASNTAELDYETMAVSHVLSIEVTDNGFPDSVKQSSVFTVRINVNDINEKPEVATTKLSITENSAAGSNVGTIVCRDPDRADVGKVSATIKSQEAQPGTGANTAPFSISNAATGVLTVSTGSPAVKLDYESKAKYTITVECQDQAGLKSDPTGVVVELVDVNEKPACTSPGTLYAPEGMVITVGKPMDSYCVDPDADDELSFSLITGDSSFSVDPTTGQVSITTAVADPTKKFTLSIGAEDKAGLSTTVSVNVEMTDQNDAPAFPSSTPAVVQVSESAVDGTVVYTFAAEDEDFATDSSHRLTYTLTPTGRSINRDFPFTITTTDTASGLGKGALKLDTSLASSSLDHEGTQNEFDAIITAVDNGSPMLSGTFRLTIQVADAPEPPTFDAFASTTPAIDTATGLPILTLEVDEGVNANEAATVLGVTDPDASSAGKLMFASSGASSLFDEWLVVHSTTGEVRARKALDYESILVAAGSQNAMASVLSATVTVTDEASKSVQALLRVVVKDVNEPPSAPASLSVQVSEAAEPGTLVTAIAATDPDSGARGRLLFSINASDSAAAANFRVDPLSGDITLASSSVNWEDQASYAFTVVIEDGDSEKPLRASTLVSIAIVNENDVIVDAIQYDQGDNLCRSFPCASDSLVDDIVRPLNPDASSTGLFFTPLGGATIRLLGSGFGFTERRLAAEGLTIADVDITVTYGQDGKEYTAADCVLETAHTVIRCKTVASWGGKHTWKVTVNKVKGTAIGHSAMSAFTTSSMPPSISDVTTTQLGMTSFGPTIIPTWGGAMLSLAGSGLGQMGEAVSVTYGGPDGKRFSAKRCSAGGASQDAVDCLLASAGLGANLKFVVVTRGLQSDVFDSKVSYAKPTVASVKILEQGTKTLTTRGGQAIEIVGTQLSDGSFPSEVLAVYGPNNTFAASSCRIVTAHTQMVCMSAPGTGKDLAVSVVIGGQNSDASEDVISYTAPSITDVAGTGASGSATQGGEPLIVLGDDFGPDSTSLSNIVVEYGPAMGGSSTLRYRASGCRYGASHTEIVCSTVPGTGRAHSVRLVVSGQEAVAAAAMSYAPPVVAMYEGDGSSESATSGSEEVVVIGKNFGPIDHGSIDLVVYRKATDGTNVSSSLTPTDPSKLALGDAAIALDVGSFVYKAGSCRVVEPHTRLSCLTAEGAGRDLQWAAVIDGQVSRAPSTSYGRPHITSIAGIPTAGATSDGREAVAIRGENFGPSFIITDGQRAGFLSAVTYGPSRREYAARNCSLVSHTEIRCQTSAGVGAGHRWRVVVGEQETEEYPLSQEAKDAGLVLDYADPVISSITPSSGSTEGGFLVRIAGTNLGILDERLRTGTTVSSETALDESAFRVRFGSGIASRIAPVVSKTTDLKGMHSVDFLVPESDGGSFDVTVETIDPSGTVTVSNRDRFAFGKPTIVDEIYAVRVFGKKYNLTAIGQNFGLSPRMLVDGQVADDCEVLVPHREVRCGFTGHSGDVQIMTLSGILSNTKRFEFVSPSFLQGSADRPLLDTAGGTILKLEGLNWEADASNMNVTVNGRLCPILPIGNPTVKLEDANEFRYSLECQAPEGQGANIPVVITRMGQPSLPDTSWSYAPPSDIIVSPSTTTPTAGGSIVITGRNLGVSGNVIIPNAFVNATSWTHNRIEAVVSPGEGGALDLVVDVAQQVSKAVAFSFAAPSITSAPRNGNTAGTVAASIVGSNFGVLGPRVTLYKAPMSANAPSRTLVCNVSSFTHTSIAVDLPEGTGKGWSLLVDISGQSTPASSAPFDFNPPVVASLQYNKTTGLPTSGGIPVVAIGANFGSAGAVLQVQPAGTGSAGLLSGAFVATSISQTHDRAEFLLPEGQGDELELVVVVDGQTSSPVPFAYDPPRVDSVALPAEVPTEGTWRSRAPVRHEVMTISGASFGVQASQRTEVRLVAAHPEGRFEEFTLDDFRQGIKCPISVEKDPERAGAWRDAEDGLRKYEHTVIRAGIPEGYGKDLRLVVAVGDRLSNPFRFSYDPPVVQAIIPNVPVAGTCPKENAAAGTCAAASVAGESVNIVGKNFGETPPLTGELDIRISDLSCGAQSWNRDGSYKGRPYLTCTMPWDTAGAKNVSVFVALQNAEMWKAEDGLFLTECDNDAYGADGEFCLECPRGAECPGKDVEPKSLPGWYDVRPNIRTDDPNKEDDELCPAERRDPSIRDYCYKPLPCEPKLACIGDSKCAVGYDGVRCSQCLKGEYYRINGLCEKCPDNPWLVVAAFIALALFACFAGYIINQKQVNVGMITVGVDYFQVLAIFARTRVRWPAIVRQILTFMSAFNLNIELAAPECAVPDVTYLMKWFFSMALPLAAALVFGLVYLVQLCYKRCCKGVKDKAVLHQHANKMVSVLVVVFIFLYMYLSRLTLDVFNCAPTDPPDGNLYMSGMLEIVCFETDTHLVLFPFAIGAAIFYVAGLPIVSFLLVRRNLETIKYDQVLRARRVHPSSKLMPDSVRRFRERWNRVYYLFRPGKSYWLTVVLGRKFLIAFASLVFRSTPSYQMATCILVLFAAFTLQVRHVPYMSLGDHAQIVEEFVTFTSQSNTAAHGTKQYRVRSRMEAHEKRFELEKTRSSGGGWDAAAMAFVESQKREQKESTGIVAEYLVNYNTVEMVLLGCGILVNLSGIMFLSERFGEALGAYYVAEYDALAAIVAAIILISVFFFLLTLITEVLFVVSPQAATRCFSMCVSKRVIEKRKQAAKLKGSAKSSSGGSSSSPASGASLASVSEDGSEIKMLNNPVAASRLARGDGISGSQLPDAPPGSDVWTHVKSTYIKNEARISDLHKENQRLTTALKQAEAMQAIGGAGTAKAIGGAGSAAKALRRKAKPAGRRMFAPKSSATPVDASGDMPRAMSSSKGSSRRPTAGRFGKTLARRVSKDALLSSEE